jgi:6-pyruvoyltetrahydropterin/6-carboxytetrahydropterin synthase
VYYVTKTYDHNLGLSACFRQPFASSHCHDPHGYPLSFKLTFGATALDPNNWVLDFGGLKPIKAWLCENFDHRTILSARDPFLGAFQELYRLADFKPILVLPNVGCEAFAKYVFDHVDEWLGEEMFIECDIRGLLIKSVEVREHGGNSAIFEREPL